MTQLSVLSILAVALLWSSLFAAEDAPYQLLRFASVFDGLYSDADEVKADQETSSRVHTLLRVTYRPVTVPALLPKFTFFIEEDHGNVVKRQLLATAELDPNTGSIIISPHNFTHKYNSVPGTFDVESLRNLERSNIYSHKDCRAMITEIDENVFTGSWPDCTNADKLATPAYTMTLTCTELQFLVLWRSLELPNVEPYRMKKISRFGLQPYMLQGADNFTDPCV